LRKRESLLNVDFSGLLDYVNAVQTRHMVVHDDQPVRIALRFFAPR
jgi:hypothetical protein